MRLGGRLVVLALTVAAWLQTAAVTAQAPSADDEEARTLFNLGREAYNEARYERALRYFRQAYELSKRPGMLFNIASAADRLRRDAEALEAFRQYLAEVPDAENRGVVERRIAALEKVVPQTSEPKAEPERTPAIDPQAVARAAPEPEAPSAGYTEPDERADEGSKSIVGRWWFWAGVGGVVAAGVIVGIAASSGGSETTFADPPVVDAQTRVIGL